MHQCRRAFHLSLVRFEDLNMIIRFIENKMCPGGVGLASTEEFIIDTDKVAAFRVEHQRRLDYVEHHLADAERGVCKVTVSRKFSFGDCLGWYDELLANDGAVVEHTMEIEIWNS